MEFIKYRSVHYSYDGVFSHFSYWGMINHKGEFSVDCFTSPSQCSGTNISTHDRYTGKLDVNNIMIFEGDICHAKRPYASTHVVKWDYKRCSFYLQPIDGVLKASYDKGYKMNSGKLEVIGNIYGDNTE